MKRHPIGFRYAKAMFEYADEKNTLDQTLEELNVVLQAFKDAGILDNVFTHPKMTKEVKKNILRDAFNEKISQEILNLLYILVDNGRMQFFPQIVEDFKHLVNEKQNVAEAYVTTVKPLTDEEKEAINEVFSKIAGKDKLHIHSIVDKDIIGGLKVRIGDRVYDGSVARQLERIQKEMTFGNVSR